MADIQQNSYRAQKYRYSIPRLIQLSRVTNCPFDLSKFSYDAARAGVIPSLSDCTMSSRKSSASCTKGTNFETASSSDLLLFQGTQVLRPERQPYLPPPSERQKDEGFARFLKKHSSPTHNRVTAGGRIVPMEPRSPPSFSLPSNVSNRLQEQYTDHQPKESLNESARTYWNSVSQMDCTQNDSRLNDISVREHSFNVGVDFENERSLGIAQATALQPPGNPPTYHSPVTMNAFSYPMALPSPSSAIYPSPQNGPLMAQQFPQPSQCGAGTYQNGTFLNSGMVVPVADQYSGATSWSMGYPPLAQQTPMQPVMSPFQLLAAWSQHYADLDQQLKNIDRHRAMHSLDPRLAEQRRVIVQQRSDAKDFVREYQTILGLRRNLGSSQESWTTGFNVDAPAYVPQSSFDDGKLVSHKPLISTYQNPALTEKPRSQGQRRAIPIKPPPKDYEESKYSQNSKLRQDDVAKSNEWSVHRRVSPPNADRDSSTLPEMIPAEQDHTQHTEYIVGNQDNASASRGFDYDPKTGSYTEDSASKLENLNVRPANVKPPRNIQDEYQRLVEAVSQPKGTITKVRLLDSRVIDVEGQGLGLDSFHKRIDEQTSDAWSSSRMMQGQSSDIPSVNDGELVPNKGQLATATQFTNKENVGVTSRCHQKAATEAFLAQFNAVDNNVALAARQETQSLRTISNSRTQPDSITLSSIDDLTGLGHSSTIEDKSFRTGYKYHAEDSGVADMDIPASPDALNHKGYSMVEVQNIHAVGSVPNNYDGAVEARQNVQSQLVAFNKARSPRFLRRHGGKGGAWYGPYCRDVVERALHQSHARGPARPYFH